MEIIDRKKDHIEICLDKDVQFDKFSSGFDDYNFEHQGLPEIDIDEIDLSIELFGKKLSAPIFVSSMTGGLDQGEKINKNLAQACQNLGLAMGMGSQRITLEVPESLATFQVRDVAPDIFIFANVGAVQLNYGYGEKELNYLVDSINANALFLHLNPLQEAIQPEGDKNFKNLIEKITDLSKKLPFPIFIKETGCGISKQLAEKLNNTGIAGIDVSGGGGTSWSLIEAYRAKNPFQAKLGETFKNWGIPTSQSLINVNKISKDKIIFASGGIRSGIDVAKAITLGADAVGIAYPLLKPATISVEAVEEKLKQYIEELRISMFCLGLKSIPELKSNNFLKRI
ncbi:MAG: type 2 isopentenyl-diphosphate Delta-isomerase [Candidatus Sericytochromatia bacterium]|nr:type 2 isopentenyl-diphosphate Delta-isomerase [Candidatus Sericytochromatia bacterium]